MKTLFFLYLTMILQEKRIHVKDFRQPVHSKIYIKIYSAVDSPEIASIYEQEHKKVLGAFGVDDIHVCQSYAWLQNPETYLIVAETKSGELVGGVALVKTSSDSQLPMMKAVQKLCPEFNEFVRSTSTLGIAEVAGFWVTKSAKGQDVSKALLTALVSVSTKLNIPYQVAFVNQYASTIAQEFGFMKMEAFGKNGTFAYPNETYQSSLILLDAQLLISTHPLVRKRAMTIRKKLQHTYTNERGVVYSYDLRSLLEKTKGATVLENVRQN
ncbi:MAG: hypothetical protein GY810_12235 [Aureispira sp.]|nr:hypothetical protein [Aureispira sp.]